MGTQTTPWAPEQMRRGLGPGPHILFGHMYEDPRIELAAFSPGSRVLVIASAGDTAAVLARAGYEVTAIDINPAQLEYARARMAGAPAVAGLLEERLGRVRHLLGGVLPAWRPAELEAFLRLDDPAAQFEWWRTRLDTVPSRLVMGGVLGLARAVMLIRHPAFRHLARERTTRPGVMLRGRIAAGVGRHPNATNPYAWRLFLGRECPGHVEPFPVPDPGGVRLVLGDVTDHLERVPRGAYQGVSLSNVLDGPGPAYRNRLLRAVRSSMRPGGVMVLRSLRPPTATQDAAHAAQDRSLLWGTVAVRTVGR